MEKGRCRPKREKKELIFKIYISIPLLSTCAFSRLSKSYSSSSGFDRSDSMIARTPLNEKKSDIATPQITFFHLHILRIACVVHCVARARVYRGDRRPRGD